MLRSHRRFAGAISSVMFRGVDHVDRSDHGRLLQGAVQLDGLGECHNPTLAGASRDRSRSTSRLLNAAVGRDSYETVTQTAFWHRPNDTCTTLEGLRRRPANRTRLSEVTWRWRHRFNTLAHPQAVAVDIDVDLGSPSRSVVLEALTLYTPAAFNTFHVIGRRLIPDAEVAASPGERPEPRVLSTVDGRYAVALFTGDAGAGLGRFVYPGASKLNVVFRPQGVSSGVLQTRCGWAIGTRDEVADAVRRAL